MFLDVFVDPAAMYQLTKLLKTVQNEFGAGTLLEQRVIIAHFTISEGCPFTADTV